MKNHHIILITIISFIIIKNNIYAMQNKTMIIGYSNIRSTTLSEKRYYNSKDYKLSNEGLYFGYQFLINNSMLDFWLDSKASYHQGVHSFVTFSPGISISKDLCIKHLLIRPQIGVGLDIIMYLTSYYEALINYFSISIYPDKDNSPLGVIINYDKSFSNSFHTTLINRRLTLGLAISY